MIVRYSDNSGLLIEASGNEFTLLARTVAGDRTDIFCETDNIRPFPYERSLLRVSTKIEPDTLVNLHVAENAELLVSGSKENLIQLADEIDDFATNAHLGKDLHIEYYQGHLYLASDAISLVIERVE